MFSRLKARLSRRLPQGCKLIATPLSNVIDECGMDGPVCHVGSKLHGADAGATDAFRALFKRCKDSEFVGIDLSRGENVDVVADVCAPDLLVRHPELAGRFGLVFCSALLEHVKHPFAAAANIEGLLRPDGHLYYSGPWAWGFHGYPDDYWRISFSALGLLFPNVTWERHWYSGTKPKVGIEIDDPNNERRFFVQHKITGVAQRISEYALPYLNITAIGRRH